MSLQLCDSASSFLIQLPSSPELDMRALSCDLHLLRFKQFNGLPNHSWASTFGMSSVISLSRTVLFQGHRKFVVMQATAQLDIHSPIGSGRGAGSAGGAHSNGGYTISSQLSH